MLATSAAVADHLDAMADHLRDHGWIRQRYFSSKGTCVSGASYAVIAERRFDYDYVQVLAQGEGLITDLTDIPECLNLHIAARRAIGEVLGLRSDDWLSWNDMVARDRRDVINGLRRAAKHLRKESA